MTPTDIVFYCLMFIIACHYGTKLLDWFEERKKKESNLSEFMADLYRLQNKWAKKGEYHFCRALEMVKNAAAPEESEKEPETSEGKKMLAAMKEQIKEELLEDYKL